MTARWNVRVACEAGEAPRLVLSSEGLSRPEWESLRAQVDEVWRDLSVKCVCGHPYAAHLSRSPHPCYAPGPTSCACSIFRAAEPVLSPIGEI